MNHYTQLLYYIKSLADNDDFVNTVTQGDITSIDLDKNNIFPLVHVAVTGGGFTNGQTIVFNVQLSCLDIRDINNEIRESKYWEQDNEVDNLNETLAVLNRMWTIMYQDFEDKCIIASENPTLEIVTESNTNLLDGWILSFDVIMPNEILNLCE